LICFYHNFFFVCLALFAVSFIQMYIIFF
jgi:hypothetical protein